MESETKHDKFVRLAENRTNKIIGMLRLLGNCANKSNYDYSDEEVKKIFDAIDREVKTAKSKFNGSDGSEERFTLK